MVIPFLIFWGACITVFHSGFNILQCHQYIVHKCSNFSISLPNTFFAFLKNCVMYFWLCWVFIAVCGSAPVVVSGGRSSYGVWASCCRGFSCTGWAQQLGHTGLVALQHVESSQTRDRTVSPVLVGEFSTIGHQGSPIFCFFGSSHPNGCKVVISL